MNYRDRPLLSYMLIERINSRGVRLPFVCLTINFAELKISSQLDYTCSATFHTACTLTESASIAAHMLKLLSEAIVNVLFYNVNVKADKNG